MTLFGVYVKNTSKGDLISSMKHFPTSFKSVRNINEIDETIDEFYNEIDKMASEFQEKDSGWAIDHFEYIQLTICKLENIPIGRYIPLPKQIANKKAVTNVRNYDIYCFKWCVLAAIALKHDNLNNIDEYK